MWAAKEPQDTLEAQRMNRDHWSIEGKQIAAKIEAASLCEDLIAKKGELKHGEFKTWIEANCEFSYAAANQYMKVAKAKLITRDHFDGCTSYRAARKYMQIAKAKWHDHATFGACSTMDEVLNLGKKPKPAPAKVEPTEDDLKTISNLPINFEFNTNTVRVHLG